MDLLKERDKLNKLRKELKSFQKDEIYDRMVSQWEWTSEDLRYAFEYLDEAVKAIPNISMCIYHASVFFNKELNVKTEENSTWQ